MRGPLVDHSELQTRSAHPLPTLIPSGGPALPDFAGLFYNLKFHDGGERHEGCASYMKSTWCWHWSCASTLCKNSWKTPNVEYYTLTKVGWAPKTVQDAYLKVLGKRKEDVNFNNQVICSMHWSCGKRIKFGRLAKRQIYWGRQSRVPESQARALELCWLRSAPISGPLKTNSWSITVGKKLNSQSAPVHQLDPVSLQHGLFFSQPCLIN